MNKYKVKVTHLYSEVVDIEAENEEGARQKVAELIQKEDFKLQPQYETTIPPEHWQIITEEEFQKLIEAFTKKMQQEENKEESNIITP